MSNNRETRRKAARLARRSGTAAATIGLVAGQIALGSPASASTFDVTNCNADGSGSFVAAWMEARMNAGADVIQFAANLDCVLTVSDTFSTYDDQHVTINGSGVGKTVFKYAEGGVNSMFYQEGADLELNDVTIDGNNVDSGTLFSGWYGNLTLNGVEIKNAHMQNITQSDSTAVNINDSYIHDNAGYMGGIFWPGALTGSTVDITNSTFVNNVFSEGTLVYTFSSDASTIKHSTFVNNSSKEYSNHNFMSGNFNLIGNIFANEDPTETFDFWQESTINEVANLWTAQPKIQTVVQSLPTATAGLGESAVTTFEALKLSDPAVNLVNPTNSGAVPTVALEAGSIALDYFTADDVDGATLATTDARGVARPQGAGFDVGAYEWAANSQECVVPKLGSVYFKPYSSVLVPTTKRHLDKFSAKIAASGCTEIKIVGHSASIDGQSKATAAYRKALSTKRAKQVQRYLQKKLVAAGVEATFKVSAVAATAPAKSNATAAGRAANRRVQISVVQPVR